MRFSAGIDSCRIIIFWFVAFCFLFEDFLYCSQYFNGLSPIILSLSLYIYLFNFAMYNYSRRFCVSHSPTHKHTVYMYALYKMFHKISPPASFIQLNSMAFGLFLLLLIFFLGLIFLPFNLNLSHLHLSSIDLIFANLNLNLSFLVSFQLFVTLFSCIFPINYRCYSIGIYPMIEMLSVCKCALHMLQFFFF